MSDTRTVVDGFLKGQAELKVGRAEIARSLFNRKYSEAQVAIVMGIHPKTAHAFKKKFHKTDEGATFERQEIKNYLRGSAVSWNAFYHAVNALVGVPAHTKAGEKLHKRGRKPKTVVEIPTVTPVLDSVTEDTVTA